MPIRVEATKRLYIGAGCARWMRQFRSHCPQPRRKMPSKLRELPPWVEIAAGGLGVAFALWSIGRRMDGKPMHPDAKKADVGLLVFGCLLVLVGVIRMVG